MSKAKAMQTVSDFEMALKARSAMFCEDGEPSYPFISGYLLSVLREIAEDHPKVGKKLAERVEMIRASMGNSK